MLQFRRLRTEIDLSTWTCKKFQSASKDDVGVILAWLDGYYKGENDPPVIDTDKFVANAKKLGEYCSAHPRYRPDHRDRQAVQAGQNDRRRAR